MKKKVFTTPSPGWFKRVPVGERFWQKVDKRGPDECWPWLGGRRGISVGVEYGGIWVDGRNRQAHRVAWELTNGVPFPKGMLGCHRCDNPICVNPSHIFPGTNSDNQKDSAQKGRHTSPGRRYWTHCARGHLFDAKNTYVMPNGWRSCRECQRATLKRWRDRVRARKAQAAASA